MDYKQSGVDIGAGNETVRRIRSLARATFTPGVLSDIGTFGGLFQLDVSRHRRPVLVASADGVGTKLKVAFRAEKHDTVGIDLVNHCVNDILVQGAEPLFFLDYLATGRLAPHVAAEVVGGVARGCRDNGCALLGGETAEMPGFYADGEYDLAGFIIGVVDRDRLLTGSGIRPGDILIGLPSAGLHTNGYSLARRIIFDRCGLTLDSYLPELGATVGNLLLEPHRSYLSVVRPLFDQGVIKGMAHITGGGLTENVPRMLPAGCAAEINLGAWQVPPIFTFLQGAGDVADEDMRRTFNLGIGLVIACGPDTSARALSMLASPDQPGARRIGSVVPGPQVVHFTQQ